jgi:hypothetical protein
MFHGSTGRLGRQCECGGEGDADTLAASFNACQTIFSMRRVMVSHFRFDRFLAAGAVEVATPSVLV